ncbi:MAG: 50S ribosomal protein L4 [Candidatus Diapherotrites archaeon]|uniref:50S ribosomal protein L4 n=1 Tax=Candidatus Iainarchaeum sp. TaxID=3101447 RepID=A0A938YSX2_9ARCH|nr:50S ribosomal protein L4 [Candidatus Diapherotrites archaeon]
MKAGVFSLEGKKLHEIELPKQFQGEVDSALIKRAVQSIEAAAIQPRGTKKRAGRQNTARYRGKRDLPSTGRGINVGRARLPRLKNRRDLLYGRVAGIPRAVGGPKAHPPKVEKNRKEKINKKEKRAALESAIAACTKKELVEKRHSLPKEAGLPVIVEDNFEKIAKTKEVLKAFKALGLADDVESAKQKTRKRAGKGKKRGRKKKIKKSVLIVTKENSQVFKAARNLPGVECTIVKHLNAKLLAPGSEPGRLTVWSESAVKELGKGESK